MIAQTLQQLLDQLSERSLPDDDWRGVQEAHVLAEHQYQGLNRRSGKPFIDHAVGTASLTALGGGDSIAVSAALLHACRTRGVRFLGHRVPLLRRGFPSGLDPSVRRLVEVFEGTHRKLSKTDAPLAALSNIDAQKRDAVLIHVANEVDEILDGSAQEYKPWKLRPNYLRGLLSLCEACEFPELSRLLESQLSCARPTPPNDPIRPQSSQ